MITAIMQVRPYQAQWIQEGFADAARALGFAARYHEGRRLDGSPEISHPIEVARFIHRLAPFPGKNTALVTACLHDVREDYGVSDCAIRALFGDRSADAVALVTKSFRGHRLSSLKAFSQPARCPIAAIVKGADRIHNLRTMNGAFSLAKQGSYRAETRLHILPMLIAATGKHPGHADVLESIINTTTALAGHSADAVA